MTVETSPLPVAKTTFELFAGQRRRRELHCKRLVGHAHLPMGSDLYELKLMMLPGNTYYMKQNREGLGLYTIYSGKMQENDRWRLLNPVGFGRVLAETKDYVQIYFPLLGRLVFLDIYPKNRGEE